MPKPMSSAPIDRVRVNAYTIPTSSPESDGTLQWNKTTMVLVRIEAGGQTGLGYTYADEATATLIHNKLADVITKEDAFNVGALWAEMIHETRNLGRTSIVAMAISAVDNALWDLKARLLGLPLVKLLGMVREGMPIYGSGGFTSYSMEHLESQLKGWVEQGIPRVKMKIGRDPQADLKRVHAVRRVIGRQPELFVDANGAYSRKQALAQAQHFAAEGLSWFEEPVVHTDLPGLRLLRDRVPATMEIASGEYGYDLEYFQRVLDAGAVDVLQADVTRCSGITGFLQVAALCQLYKIPLSAHCAPAQHLHVACAALPLRHAEYFYDHVRIERMFFGGFIEPLNGVIHPDLSRPGNGLEFKEQDAERAKAA